MYVSGMLTAVTTVLIVITLGLRNRIEVDFVPS